MNKVTNGEISCDYSMMHAYSSHQDFKRHCDSTRKKQRLHVDGVTDEEDVLSAFAGASCDVSTDFCVQSMDGTKVLSSWYFPTSANIKKEWIDVLRANQNK